MCKGTFILLKLFCLSPLQKMKELPKKKTIAQEGEDGPKLGMSTFC